MYEFKKMEKNEVDQVVGILEETKKSLNEDNAVRLKEVSNDVVSLVSKYQDSGNINLAVLIYALGKLIERSDHKKIKNWKKFIMKFNVLADSAVDALKSGDTGRYESSLQEARNKLNNVSVSLGPYIKELFRKASINKASKVYESGISLGQTAKMLGTSRWELSDYASQSSAHEENYNKTLTVKKRIKTAMEFFK